ncbi:MAG: hypothetical protein K0U93_17980 [Gammaproteobacteria bacterium]|nr:hypothetical protein [Gammaproteobacteria bacterium]
MDNPVAHFLSGTDTRTVGPLLAQIATQALEADHSRTVQPDVISALKASDAVRLSASRELGGAHASILAIGRELEAVAAACTSTAWCLWNHLSVFHLFVGALGPKHSEWLKSIVADGGWVSFPAGAGSGVHGRPDGDHFILNGPASWGSGTRYADWTGVVFALTGADGQPLRPVDLRFTVIPTNRSGLVINPTWDGAALRASATDDLTYNDVVVEASQCVRWFGANRAESLREVPVIHPRYREDWVGLSDVWLGWMGVGVVSAALDEACASIRHRRAIMGTKMVERASIQLNLGKAGALVAAAKATMATACDEIDARIRAAVTPSEGDYLHQMALSSMALNQLGEAMDLLTRSQGGNALREGTTFERRARDFRAFPLHINAHQDRVTHQVGRHLLGLPLEPF